jgi:hypothetical protein
MPKQGVLWIFMGIGMDMNFRAGSLNITPECLNLIAKIDEFKGAWKALGTLASRQADRR